MPDWRWLFPSLSYGNTALVFGGYNSKGNQRKAMLKLTCDEAGNCGDWETFGYLTRGRHQHKALWIPRDIVPC